MPSTPSSPCSPSSIGLSSTGVSPRERRRVPNESDSTFTSMAGSAPSIECTTSTPAGASPRRVASACESTERLAPVSMTKRNGPWPLILMRATARPAVSLVVVPATLGASASSGSHARVGTVNAEPATNKAAPANLMKRVMRRLCAGGRRASSEAQEFPGVGHAAVMATFRKEARLHGYHVGSGRFSDGGFLSSLDRRQSPGSKSVAAPYMVMTRKAAGRTVGRCDPGSPPLRSAA